MNACTASGNAVDDSGVVRDVARAEGLMVKAKRKGCDAAADAWRTLAFPAMRFAPNAFGSQTTFRLAMEAARTRSLPSMSRHVVQVALARRSFARASVALAVFGLFG